jgi:outer membrane protein TolC
MPPSRQARRKGKTMTKKTKKTKKVRRNLRDMTSKFVAAAFFATFLFTSSSVQGQVDTDRPTVRIGVVQDGQLSNRGLQFLELVRVEMLDLVGRDFDLRVEEEHRRTELESLEAVDEALDALLADPTVDIIAVMGDLAVHAVAARESFQKPVVVDFVVDIAYYSFPYENGISGVDNLTYSMIPDMGLRSLVSFRDLVQFQKLAMIVGPIPDAARDVVNRQLDALAEILGHRPSYVEVGDSVEESLAAIPPDADAAYVLPLLHLAPEAFDALVEGLNNRKIPTLSAGGRNDVEAGLLATFTPEVTSRVARRMAINVHRILLGDAAGDLPVNLRVAEKLVLNMETARRIGYNPPVSKALAGELLNREFDMGVTPLSLELAVTEAISNNLQLAAEEYAVAAGAQEVNLARSFLLPQLDASADGFMIDEDRAEASFGRSAERTLSGSLGLSQVIYDESLWAGLSVQRSIQDALVSQLNSIYLDVALEAGEAYLSVLRAKALLGIEHSNFGVTLTNLDLAEARREVGQASPDEVFRWQSQLADNRRELVNRFANQEIAEIELNQVLNRGLDDPIELQETGLHDPVLAAVSEIFELYANDRMNLSILASFLSQEGIENSPELKAVEAALAASERTLLSARRSFWLPRVGLGADVTTIFDTGGAGSDVEPLPDLDSNDTSWILGVNVTLPLVTGGSRIAEQARAREQTWELTLRRDLLEQIVHRDILTATYLAAASHIGIGEARAAADAAARTLELVTDQYSRGAVDIINLLEAQNVALVREQTAANAIYDFLIDAMRLQRTIGAFTILQSEEEVENLRNKLDSYVRAQN